MKDFNGKKVDVEAMRESLMNFPSHCRKDISQDGTPYLHNCVERESPCGCRVVGNGSLPFPLSVQHCKKHSK